MSALAYQQRKYTIEEYIELLLNSDERFEYFDGEIVSMAGGKISHGAIGVNVTGELRSLLAGSPCRVFNGDVAVKTVLAPPFRYPDASVACGKVQIEKLHGLEMVLNPIFICEVLSPSTASYDRDDKFWAYQAIESFQEYLLVEQHRPHVIRYCKQPDNQWVRSDVIGLESFVELESLGITVSLNEIYRMIEFPVPETDALTPDQSS